MPLVPLGIFGVPLDHFWAPFGVTLGPLGPLGYYFGWLLHHFGFLWLQKGSRRWCIQDFGSVFVSCLRYSVSLDNASTDVSLWFWELCLAHCSAEQLAECSSWVVTDVLCQSSAEQPAVQGSLMHTCMYIHYMHRVTCMYIHCTHICQSWAKSQYGRSCDGVLPTVLNSL